MAGLLDHQVRTWEPLPVRYGSTLAADSGAFYCRDAPGRAGIPAGWRKHAEERPKTRSQRT